MTMPGIPVVWAGDEFGLTGADGEESRTPMPWDRVGESAETIDLYRRLIALKREHPALNGGGIRWLHASDEAVAFVRESAEECVLVLATRSAVEVDLAGELPGPRGAARGRCRVERGARARARTGLPRLASAGRGAARVRSA